MTEVLTAPFAVAALVLCVAGAAKLRAPRTAASALRTVGLPAGVGLVRAFALVELAVGSACVVRPGAAGAAVLGFLYGLFAVVAVVLIRRRAACGCFGDNDEPASSILVLLSSALAFVAIAAAVRSPHGAGWTLGRPALQALGLVVAIGGTVYAIVVAYTDLPRAWTAWSQG